MSDEISFEDSNKVANSDNNLHKLLKKCANFQSSENLLIEDFNDVTANSICNYYKMLSTPSPNSTRSSNVSSTSSYASGESSFGENILEENGRISLAYENLRTIPKRIAEKFAAHTKCLDLSYNNFQNLSFLSFFEALHTLILDRNGRLDVNTLPYLPNLRILWINNCDISNVATWIQRIQMQCPVLEQLSIMGNPGINSNFSYCTLNSDASSDPATPTSVVADYREYIFHVLPDLEYLDGVSRSPSTLSSLPTLVHSCYGRKQKLQNNNNFKIRSTAETEESIKDGYRPLNGKSLVIQNNNKNHNNYSNIGFINNINNCSNNNSIKNTPTLSFKEIFRIKRKKKSYQTSSTN